jgi:hypothetical protein
MHSPNMQEASSKRGILGIGSRGPILPLWPATAPDDRAAGLTQSKGSNRPEDVVGKTARKLENPSRN